MLLREADTSLMDDDRAVGPGDASAPDMVPIVLCLTGGKINWSNLCEGQFGSIHYTNAHKSQFWELTLCMYLYA